MFPNYIFVRFDPEVVHTTAIKATRGISTLISFGGLPSVVPDSVITQLSQGWAVRHRRQSPHSTGTG
jgi:transcriptional antiterminator RfaH